MQPWQNPPPCKQCENLRAEVERLRALAGRFLVEQTEDNAEALRRALQQQVINASKQEP